MIITTKDGKKYNVAAENMSDEEKNTETNSEKKEEQEEKTSPVLQFCKKHGKEIAFGVAIVTVAYTLFRAFVTARANQDGGLEAADELLSACNRNALPEESRAINKFAASDISPEPDEIQENVLEMIDTMDAVARTHAPHTTNMHLRTLPEGWTASPEKKLKL